jgi:hypothetical protein
MRAVPEGLGIGDALAHVCRGSDNDSDTVRLTGESTTEGLKARLGTAVCRTEVDQHDLIFTMVDEWRQGFDEQYSLGRR